ncbi:glutaminyl-peptide cyclotransferase [Corynebacterium anserum]|uniref:glutaminyl-peptide cyclotransferase n=1 Tax=Corynebacterium anserum TaxID=2684406 RepID=UPI001FE37D59|nr:glutaminyl-peptide cyclotransferase [Corynebacterium anserum]
MSHPDTISGAATLPEDAAIEHLSPQIVATYAWNPESFTQGVEVDEGRNLIVGTGLYGESRIYRATLNGEETDSHRLPQQFFGEGITIHGDKVWQLTWKSGTAFERRRNDLSVIKTVNYEGQGWGICSDGERLIMSDGSGTLVFRHPESFEQIGSVNVTIDGQPTTYLNELDCSEDGSIYANVWQTDHILRIDPASGDVTGVIDTAGAFDARFRPGADVLNGIAHIPGSDRYLLTGKKWDTAYEVRFVPTVT